MGRETAQAALAQGFNLARSINFWTGRTLTQCGDKGGSFNMDLYLKYLEVRRQE